jgi:hypothetical protein
MSTPSPLTPTCPRSRHIPCQVLLRNHFLLGHPCVKEGRYITSSIRETVLTQVRMRCGRCLSIIEQQAACPPHVVI